ncbi:monooxygenase 2-like [Vigna unguiculata]|uniref:monooxygenase 2-like n=1 Tax=Vigna unguiculata TaxID=3917 RepID=UPI00101623F9|nr:monooxygenase 2-like [Vigna unguiculata]
MESSVVENIVIVGAGIAGLATSLALHRLGVRSLVLEYSDSLRVTGFGLTTWTNAWKALDALGVGDILRNQHLQLQRNVTTSLSLGQQTSSLSLIGTGKHGDGEVRCVRRQLMIEALGNELPSGTIRFSSKVVAIQESGFFKIVHLADGTTIKTKVLVGCDGINSVVAKWLGFKEASFTGRYVIRGDIKLTNKHGLQPNFMHFFGEGFRSGVLPCDDKTVYWFFTWTPTTEEKELVNNPAKMKRLVLNKFEKMPSDIRCFIEKTETEDILTSPLRYRHQWELVLGNISKGNVCVVGDAFHPMAPDLGQGGCCSLEDGIVLGRYLAQAFCKKGESEEQYKEIEASLRKYAKERRWRSIDISVTSYVLGLLLQGDLKLVAHVRDKVLPHFLAELLLKKSDFDCGKLNTSD